MIGRKRFGSQSRGAGGAAGAPGDWPTASAGRVPMAGRRPVAVLSAVIAVLIAVAASFAASSAPGCDTDAVRARAEQDFPRYRVDAVGADHGIVTLLLRAREGTGAIAVALHASGTQLATSVSGTELKSSDLADVSEPVSTWWQVTDVQRALVACSEPGASGDLQSALRSAAEAALPRTAPWLEILGVQISWMGVGAALFLALLIGVVVGLWKSRDRLADRDTSMLLVLTALALLLRVIAHAGPANTREVINDVSLGRAGWAALLHLIFSVLPMRDETIWTINRIIGALSVPLLYVVMRRRFTDRIAAIAGAATLAVTPLITRFCASDTPYIALCAAFLGAIAAYDRYVETGSTGAMALGLGLLTAALQLRPEGPWLIVPAALIAAAGGVPDDVSARLRRPTVAICALLFVAINVVLTICALQGNGQHVADFVLVGSVFGSPWADPETTPRMLGALVALGTASALIYRFRWAGCLWAAATLIALPLYQPMTVRSAIPVDDQLVMTNVPDYAVARYHIPAMYLACGLAGLGVATLLGLVRRRSGRAASVVAVGIVCVAAAPQFDLMRRMWTPQLEFEFFRDGVRQIDSGCRLVTVLTGMDAGFYPFAYLRPKMIDAETFLADPPTADCVVYYRAANCFALNRPPEHEHATVAVNPACRAIEERFRLELITEASLPATPYNAEVYTRNVLPVGFYRVRDD